jgi:RimJ/RimL family protein N-acetyltransferase
MSILATERLILRELTHQDAPFILELLNEEDFLRYIGDKGVRNLDDARAYLSQGPMDSYHRHGFGLYAVTLQGGTPIGICGLVRREGLDDPDVGFALFARFRGQGYAVEAARAVLKLARETLRLPRVLAITSLDNAASIAVLGKIGLRFVRIIRLGNDDKDLRLFA